MFTETGHCKYKHVTSLTAWIWRPLCASRGFNRAINSVLLEGIQYQTSSNTLKIHGSLEQPNKPSVFEMNWSVSLHSSAIHNWVPSCFSIQSWIWIIQHCDTPPAVYHSLNLISCWALVKTVLCYTVMKRLSTLFRWPAFHCTEPPSSV